MKRLVSWMAIAAMIGAAAPSAPDRELATVRLAELAGDVKAFRDRSGALPSSLDGLAHVASREALLADPWGNDVFYLRVAGGFWLMSWGADGQPGGDGDAADVVHIAR